MPDFIWVFRVAYLYDYESVSIISHICIISAHRNFMGITGSIIMPDFIGIFRVAYIYD